MTTHHCPRCALIYTYKTELENHLRSDHPDAHFDYPVEHRTDEDWPLSQEPRKYSWRPTYRVRHTP